MKELDKTKKYDLSKLTDEQLKELLNWMKKNDTGWDNVDLKGLKTKPFICYDFIEWNQYTGSNATCATELF